MCEMILIVVLIWISLMIRDVEFFFHMSIGHLHVLFGEVSIHALGPFLNWIVSLPGIKLY